jgi:hypothetical protein
MKYLKSKLVHGLFIWVCFLPAGCYVTKYNSVPVYDTRQVPYHENEVYYTDLPPIVPGDNHVIAFTRFAGGEIPTVEQVQENIKLGFQEQQSNNENLVKNIKFISRAELLRSFTRTELEEMGPVVEQMLKEKYGVNIICTGTILSDAEYKLSVEVLDYGTDSTYNSTFTGNNWSAVGSEVAKAFFGTRKLTNYREVTKYRNEEYISDYKKEAYREYDDGLTNLFLLGLLTVGLIWLLGSL